MKVYKIISVLLITLLIVNCDNEDDSSDPPPNIDLKADAITFSVESISQFTGDATIKGIITNIGDDFSSGEGQQIIRLYERQLGTPTNQSGELVASVSFQSLAAGENLEVSYTRLWNRSSPAEGEFPPDYILRIEYDPDLLIDGNDNNNDSNVENNTITESGSAINDLF